MPIRRRLEAAACASAGALVAGWTLRTLGLPVLLALRSAVTLGFATLPWGFVATGSLGKGALLRGERWVLAMLVGYPISAAIYFFLALGQARAAFLPLTGVVALAISVFRLRDRGVVSRDSAPASLAPPHVTLWLLAPLSAFELLRWNRAFSASPAGLEYEHSVDHSIHLAYYWELLRGIPAQQLPIAAGVPFPAYHWLSFMHGLLLLDSQQVAVTTAYHALSPLFKVTLLIAAVYLTVRIRTGDGRVATAAVPAAFLTAHAIEIAWNDRFISGPPPDFDLIRNEAAGGGLVTWASVLCLLALYDRLRADSAPSLALTRALSLAALLAGLSYAFKAQIFVLFGGALGLALLLTAIRERSSLPLRGLTAMSVAFLAVFAASSNHGRMASVGFSPGLFAESHIYPNLRRDGGPVARTLLAFFESIPRGLGFVLAVPFAIWRLVLFSPFVPAYLANRAARAGQLGLLDAVLTLVFLLALPMGWAFSVVSYYQAPSAFEFRYAAHGLALLGAPISLIVLHRLLEHHAQKAGALVLAMACATVIVVAPLLASETSYVPARGGIVMSPDEQCALLFLRRGTPPDAVVISARTESFEALRARGMRLNHQAVVAGFAGRRAVLEFSDKDVDWDHDRERDIRRFFRTAEPDVAKQILERYRVDYVVESSSLPLRFDKSELRVAYESGPLRVYAASPRARDREPFTLPAAFLVEDELRCPSDIRR